ncbi:MAG: hypothetical protein RLZZ393_2086 [Pseudomonadota bacterium]|jgi:hypothetical protein
MKYRMTMVGALFAGLVSMQGTTLAATPAEAALAAPVTCDRACLYKALDEYLAALKAHDPSRIRWSAKPKLSENNVELRVGDGLWGTLTALGDYEMRLADPQTAQVAVFGVVEETKTKSPYALRLKFENGAVRESELLVVRPEDAGIPFVTADMQRRPVFEEMLAPAQRTPRDRMVAAANGYFDTLQLNDGTLRTQFTDDCNRRENGMISTNRKDPGLDPIWRMGCADQFRQGAYRYDDRLRDRRFILADEEKGIVVAGGFIDHEGRLKEFRQPDGTVRESHFHRPHSFVLLEAFKIKQGKIEAVEAVFHTVPYNMPTPWLP